MIKFDCDEINEIDLPTGAAFMIKKEVIDDIGLFDERFFLGYGAADFYCRAKKAGYKIFFVPHAKIMHYGGASVGRVVQQVTKLGAEDKLKFFVKHYGLSGLSGF